VHPPGNRYAAGKLASGLDPNLHRAATNQPDNLDDNTGTQPGSQVHGLKHQPENSLHLHGDHPNVLAALADQHSEATEEQAAHPAEQKKPTSNAPFHHLVSDEHE
jgi:hypothetical protein